ncbi:uncharacterized protein GIQ15_04784 [Arthroderma uncinatum]|uniref:uncharacterized protein n=1 Tax=Arthroderma uncinatum TaxID=74035 RepID=UPI00144AA4CD|nr:uncharacterized protein GIQ15_04784 [Arthroderma uncinatum]KAF3482025.1 hypothetical protein GIQ15_04784 [Arthroderma uncinatum]
MIRPAHLLTTSFFYPTGNTPAVCLTRSLPPGQDVSLLLLGCGDVRNVLFTAYADLGSARNVLFYTLILDDLENENVKNIWNLYNGVLVSTAALTLLRDQAKKLIGNTKAATNWNDGKYGKILRFCSHSTFSQVMHLWEFYALDPSNKQAFEKQQRKLKQGIEKAKEMQKKLIGESRVITGLRSAAPCSTSDAGECSKIYEQFWEEGVVLRDARSVDKAQHMNPMFGTLNERLVLHYGTQPLLGYHLATAYAPTTTESPLKYDSVDLADNPEAAKAAFAQFCAYTKAFRACSTLWTIRFVNADALAFCHTLQSLEYHDETTGPGWYRDNWHYEPFVLDPQEYPSQGSRAPTFFDVIDTSNLVDHLGSLNLLVATCPLLKRIPTSAVYTELLVRRRENTDQYVKSLLSGDLMTIGLLFKLTPIQYWTGAAISSDFTERTLDISSTTGGQSRYIIQWSRIVTEPIIFEPKQLSNLMYRMYLDMFKDEDPIYISKMKARDSLWDQYASYTRAGLCSILRLMQKSSLTDWNSFVRQYCDLITEDTHLNMGSLYLQEFYLHLYLSGLLTMPTFEPGMNGMVSTHLPRSPFRHWANIPPVLCISMVIPHHKLTLFQNAPTQKYGTPVSQIVLKSEFGLSYFPDIQLSFGEVQVSGTKFSENYALEVSVDDRGWDGNSPLIVSAMIPTSLALLLPDLSTEVLFALKITPVTLMLIKELGMELKIHGSSLVGDDVFITRYRPNMKNHLFIGPSKPNPTESKGALLRPRGSAGADGAELKFHVLLDSEQSKAVSLTTRVDITSPRCQEVLRQGAEVRVEQISPYEISIEFQGEAFYENIRLPLPVLVTNTKTRIARKSSYVEFIAPIASPMSLVQRSDNVYPVGIYENTPILQNLDYTALDKLPILDVKNKSKLGWLCPVLSDMFSARERMEREKYRSSTTNCPDTRVNFKDSLYALFGYFSGVEKESHAIFGLNNSANGGINVLIFISCLRLDISNQSVVLDGAVFPLTTNLVPKIELSLRDLTTRGMQGIHVDDDELLLWKHVLPAYVERCRTWEHLPSCEYRASGNIPLSVEFGQPLLCLCGQGKFFSDYKIRGFPEWKDIKKYAVRVAISPCNFVPFVEKAFTPDLTVIEKTTQGLSQMMKALGIKEAQPIELNWES